MHDRSEKTVGLCECLAAMPPRVELGMGGETPVYGSSLGLI